MSKRDENLKELFGRFMDNDQAERSAEDIAAGERFLSEQPAPQPSAEVLSNIKAQIKRGLKQRRYRRFTTVGYGAAAVAAAVLIVGSIAINMLNKPSKPPMEAVVSTAGAEVWDSNDFSEKDAEFALLVAQMQEIEDEITSLQRSEDGTNGLSAEELEMEFLEINNDFWKG
ncbi:MAG: hypothetical protein PVG93_03005 [Phycisphaerales bacterium]|jgi:hypothetical protein